VSGIPETLNNTIASLPAVPGVYLFKDEKQRVIYIGKAKDLRSRVRSYFRSDQREDPKTQYLKREIRNLEYIVTDTEIEALILESSLVKRTQPKLNVRLKDDKAFLHIKLTTAERFPRVFLTRRIRNDGAQYFGPYLPASLARNTIKIINRHFLLRTCNIKIDGMLRRPCLEYYIKRCLAPCVSGLCCETDYSKAVQDVILLLEGKNAQLTKRLSQKMAEASEREEFESAAFYRDRIALVQDLAERQKMAVSDGDDLDIFAYYREGPRVALQLFTFRGGRVVGKREFFWEELAFFEPSKFLRDAVHQFYSNNSKIPRKILLPLEIEEQALILEWLRERAHRKVTIVVPKRGAKLDLLMLVERNARIAFDSRFKIPKSEKTKVLESLQRELGLPKFPRLIEAFDVSNIQGAETVASAVVCEEGTMSNNRYRRFRIRSVESPDDCASIHAVVSRRYQRQLAEDKPLPDLILIDGGKGQLHSAYQALAKLGIEDTPLASIAKREELVFVQGQEEAIALDPQSPELHLLQEIRDEAHRFAVTFSARDFASELDDIPGVGEKRKKRLLQNFGSVAGVRRASIGELSPFVGRKLAERIKAALLHQ
jgi:excinuclease ABC subunit C